MTNRLAQAAILAAWAAVPRSCSFAHHAPGGTAQERREVWVSTLTECCYQAP